MITIRNQAGQIQALLTMAEYCAMTPMQIIKIIKGVTKWKTAKTSKQNAA